MNIQQAKAKLTDINRSTATKHPKVLIGELCGIIKFLLEQIDTTTMTLSARSTIPMDVSKLPPVHPPLKFPPNYQPRPPEYPTHGTTDGDPSNKCDAGDAE